MRHWSLFFLLYLFTLGARPPQISPSDAKAKMEEILRAHACYKSFTPELMKRVFQNYLDELDPTKTYFLESEIALYNQPSDTLLERALRGFKMTDYSVFHEIHALFLRAIERRNEIENEIERETLPTGVKGDEFKDLSWVKGVDELKTRIARIKALQVEAADKMGEESRGKFIQRIQKRRINREAELTGQTPDDQSKIILTQVLKAATSALDSHTNYFTPNEANQFMIQVQQRLFGIGAQLRDDLDGLTVMRILENSPAEQSMKVKINDKIIAVDGEPVLGMDITEAVELIRGEKGTTVHLTFLRDGEMMEIELVRGEVVLEDSRLETQIEPFGDGHIAMLRLFSFYQDQNFSSAQDMRKALEQIKKEHHLKGVILDLRGNAGGLLTQAVSVTGLFINKGVVVSVKDNSGKVQHMRELEGKPVWEGPLAVLVNRASASAAEIVAQTLQDYGRALVIGDPHTFGKGSFQTFTLDPINNPKVNPQGEFKVTRGRYYTVSGKSPQLQGVLSDIVVPGLLSQVDIGEEFAKFPLETDEIESHFDDDLSDLSAFQRLQIRSQYRMNLQPKLTTYIPYIDLLKTNSKLRIEGNKNYQSFLAEIEKKNFDAPEVDLFGQGDLQYLEAMNIMKDLVYLLNFSK
jgi:carboxyl-terminal processing protease